MYFPVLVAAVLVLAPACARKQEAPQPATMTQPTDGGEGFGDGEFTDDSSLGDVFADDPGLGGDLGGLGGDPSGGLPVGDPSLDVQPGEATTATQGGGGSGAQQSAMMLQSLPAMMQAMQSGDPGAMMGMMTQMMGAQGGTGGQIMQLAAPMIQQAMAQGAAQAQQAAAQGGGECFGGAACE